MKIRVEYDDGLPFAEHEIVQEHAAAWRALFGAVPAAHTEHSGTAADLAARRFADDLVKATKAAERNLEGMGSGTRSGEIAASDPVGPPQEPLVPPSPPAIPPVEPMVPPPSAPAVPMTADADDPKRRTAAKRWPWVLLGFAAAVFVLPLAAIAFAAGPPGWLGLGVAAVLVLGVVQWASRLREGVRESIGLVRWIRELRAKRRDRDHV